MYGVRPASRKFNSRLIDFSEFLANNKCQELFGYTPFPAKHDESDKDLMNTLKADFPEGELTEEYFNALAEFCNPEQLFEPNDIPTSMSSSFCADARMIERKCYKAIPMTEEALKLNTVKKLRQRIKNDPRYQYKFYNKYRSNGVDLKIDLKPIDAPPDLVPGEELLINIRMFQPYSRIVPKMERFNRLPYKPKHTFDMVVLGSHTLDVFKDKINCINDMATNDASDNPDLDSVIFAKDITQSGLIFIEDTFYNDMRQPINIDYSECIKKWAENKDSLGPFKTENIENVRFDQLKVHLGYTQLYLHHGSCEHVFIFSDVSILQPSDVCYSSHYPYCTTVHNTKGQYCNTCGSYISKWVVTNCERTPFDPVYMCDDCFDSFNFIDGKKVGDFKAYPYHEASF